LPEREQQRLLRAALDREAEAQRLLLEGDHDASSAAYHEVAQLYRRSWEAAHERAFGRLIGCLKAALLAGEGEDEAAYARAELPAEPDSPASAWALVLAALIQGDDALAGRAAEDMRGDSIAFDRTADAVGALARRDGAAYREAVRAIVADFESRTEHLTGVPIADTALVLERLAAARGLAANVSSPLLPGARPSP
jgi:hypothetical protein